MAKKIKLRVCPCCGEMVKKSHLRDVPGITFFRDGKDEPVKACKKCRKMPDEEHRIAHEKEFGTA
jgi:hypothetical protein